MPSLKDMREKAQEAGLMKLDRLIKTRQHIPDTEFPSPIRELCAFERIFLAPGERRRVEVELSDEVLGYYNEELRFVVEAGRFRIGAGGNSVDLLETEFVLER